ncbi:hypothetical protein [Azospirillum sp. B510]|uniref:hypothetical protein n=1 Tax=Azospirillum sp. (strain B510) TaxID=137722 RepID=UPI0005A6310A|nr:hypothetical protein [Azospirillum sp. B510]
MTDCHLYRLHGGRVGVRPLVRPVGLRGVQVVAQPGHEAPGLRPILPWLAAEAARVAPWSSVYVAPRLWVSADRSDDYGDCAFETRQDSHGRRWSQCGGIACASTGAAAVSLKAGVHGLPTILHHELWHLVSPRLAAADRELVYDAVERHGVDLGSTYADSPEERAARLFESWAGQWIAGAPPVACDCPVRLLCQLVYTGRYPFLSI